MFYWTSGSLSYDEHLTVAVTSILLAYVCFINQTNSSHACDTVCTVDVTSSSMYLIILVSIMFVLYL